MPILLVLFMSLFGAANLQAADSAEKALELSVKNILPRLENAAVRRPHKTRNHNDSLAATHAAARDLFMPAHQASAWQAVHQARMAHSGNSFALLLEGMLLDGQGQADDAHKAYFDFLAQSTRFGEFEKSFLSLNQHNRLRMQVYELLRARRLAVERPAAAEVVQGHDARGFLTGRLSSGSRTDQLANWFFAGVLLLGGAAILVFSLAGAEWYRPGARSIMGLYCAFWVAYLLWILDRAVGLPGGWTRFRAVPVFMAAAAVFFVLWEIAGWIRERGRPLEKGFRRCPSCREVILDLAIQCPACGRRFE